MQNKYGLKPLGPANSPIKSAIFGGNAVRLYNFHENQMKLMEKPDLVAMVKAEYEQRGTGRSNLRYGYVPKPA